MSKNNVIFRRIGGRVVPISSERRDRVAGAATAASGVAVAGAAGSYAARMTHAAAHAENTARSAVKQARAAKKATEKLGPLFKVKAEREYTKAGGNALRTMAKSRGLYEHGVKVRHAGVAVGAGLVAAGVHRALSSKDGERNPKAEAVTGAAATGVAAFAVRSQYLKGMGNKTFKAIREAAVHVAKKRIK